MRFIAKAAGLSAACRLLAGASFAAVALAGTPALAEDAAAGTAAGADEQPADSTARTAATPSGQEILVTGSRVLTNGMDSPVPVTAVSAEQLQAMDPTALINSVSQLPQFYGNTTPQSSNFFTRGGTGNLNLRGLGSNRTLTLLNSRRVPGNSAFGGVDINLFPEALISGIETVTGGASAQYGTDAVAGVVNFKLNTGFTGLQVDVQTGFTDRDDGYNYDVKAAWGVRIGERGHLLLAGSKAQQDGIHTLRGRDWYNGTGAVQVNGVWTDYPDVRSIGGSFDGIVFSTQDVNPALPGVQNPINGLQFDRNGNYAPLVVGSPSQGAVGNGGRAVGGSSDDLNSEVFTLYPDTDRYSLFAYGDYDVSDHFKLFAQYMRGYNHQFQYNNPRASLLGQPTAITIFQDNAFLPASLRQTMIANNIPSFSLRRVGSIQDIGNVWFADRITQNVFTGGFSADVADGGFLGGWKFDGYYQYGRSRRVWDQYTLRVDRLFAAVDAVRDANGNIVCRVSTFAGGAAAFPGCQPLDLFGRGNASAPAIDYVLGNDVGTHVDTPLYFANLGFTGETLSYDAVAPKRNITTFQQHFAEVSAHGDLFDLWAGPVSLAVGASYRKESIYQVVQDTANQASDFSGAFHPVMCNNPAIGLRGVNPPDCNNTVAFQFSKVSNIQGSADVKEAFAETYIPLLDNPRGVTANIDLAGRWADYSGSGTIWAYKGGMQVGLFDTIRFRGTYSRDVRAGNLSERFDKTGGVGNVLDPRLTPLVAGCKQQFGNNDPRCTDTYSVTIFSGGNPNIKPEKADTYTLGAVFTPSFLPGFSASVDWYKINIKGAIATVGTNEVARRCLADNEQQFCDLISFSGTTDIGNFPKMILVGNQYVNVAASRVQGIDAEIGYHTALKLFGGGPENLSGRLFLTWLIDRSDIGATGVTTQFDGLTGLAPDTGAPGLYPHFKGTGNLSYSNGPFSVFFQGRLIGKGKRTYLFGTTPAEEGVNIADNSVPSVFYADLRLAYEVPLGDSSVQVWASVTNLFDKAPPPTGYFSSFTGASAQYNGSLFDVLGRRYTMGIKFKL